MANYTDERARSTVNSNQFALNVLRGQGLELQTGENVHDVLREKLEDPEFKNRLLEISPDFKERYKRKIYDDLIMAGVDKDDVPQTFDESFKLLRSKQKEKEREKEIEKLGEEIRQRGIGQVYGKFTKELSGIKTGTHRANNWDNRLSFESGKVITDVDETTAFTGRRYLHRIAHTPTKITAVLGDGWYGPRKPIAQALVISPPTSEFKNATGNTNWTNYVYYMEVPLGAIETDPSRPGVKYEFSILVPQDLSEKIEKGLEEDSLFIYKLIKEIYRPVLKNEVFSNRRRDTFVVAKSDRLYVYRTDLNLDATKLEIDKDQYLKQTPQILTYDPPIGYYSDEIQK